ncbi:hypothetical protein, partial [Tenacibaculum sp. M341]|uniref:hypothetical protein n=1 Tax=Tenacibaculum sp. M341 TaxID=2530339 RepID=UPI00140499C2
FLVDKAFPKQFLKDEQAKVDDATFNFKIKKMKDFAEAGFYDYQIHQLAKGKELKPDYNPYLAVLRLTTNELRKGWF